MNLGSPPQWDGALGIKNSPGGTLRPREIQMPGGKKKKTMIKKGKG